MWYPKGSIPVVGSTSRKSAVTYGGFVILGKGNRQLFVTKPDWFTYETTIRSIRKFLAAYPMPERCQIYMILDNAPWHKKAKRLILDEENQGYEDIRSRVKFLDIPSYSPDLNPIEQVWRMTRREVTHNRYFPNNKTLEACLDDYFKQAAIIRDIYKMFLESKTVRHITQILTERKVPTPTGKAKWPVSTPNFGTTVPSAARLSVLTAAGSTGIRSGTTIIILSVTLYGTVIPSIMQESSVIRR